MVLTKMDEQATYATDADISNNGNERESKHSKHTKVDVQAGRIRVKERLGLSAGIVFIMGAVIGSGIFISPLGALKNSGSVGASLLIWVACGILSIIIALVYAELGVILPKSGGDYTIIRTGIGNIPAFLISWTTTMIIHAGSRALLALVFADYLCAPVFGACKAPDSIRKMIAAAQLLLLAITNTISVNAVASVQGLFTFLKIAALVVITVGGFVYLFEGKTENFENAFEGTTNDVTSISLAVYSCMWAYGGYTKLNEIAEEMINPKKNIPKSIIISLTLVTFIYISTNVSYFTILSKDEFLSVNAVAFSWSERVLQAGAIFIPLSVMCSVYGASNGGFFTDVRVRFAAARAGHLPEILCYLHHKTRIPLGALFFNTVVSIIMLIPADVSELINIVSFIDFLSQGLAIVSFMKLRYDRRNKPVNKDDFRIPMVLAVIALLVCICMLVSPFISNPKIEFLYGAGFILSGLILYFPFVHFGWIIMGWDKVTTFFQLFMEMCPTVLDSDLDI